MSHRADKKILVVDDQPDMRMLVRLALESAGCYQFFEAEDGAMALDLMRSLRPHVIVLDVTLPGELDGLQLCGLVKRDPILQSTAVILLTSRGQYTDIAAGERAGADAYMLKPFSPLDLINTVAKMIHPA